MPNCPPRSPEDRKSDRWENVVGKSLKDWTTRIMMQQGISREEARKVVLARIQSFDNKETLYEVQPVLARDYFAGLVRRVRSIGSWRRRVNPSAV